MCVGVNLGRYRWQEYVWGVGECRSTHVKIPTAQDFLSPRVLSSVDVYVCVCKRVCVSVCVRECV